MSKSKMYVRATLAIIGDSNKTIIVEKDKNGIFGNPTPKIGECGNFTGTPIFIQSIIDNKRLFVLDIENKLHEIPKTTPTVTQEEVENEILLNDPVAVAWWTIQDLHEHSANLNVLSNPSSLVENKHFHNLLIGEESSLRDAMISTGWDVLDMHIDKEDILLENTPNTPKM